MLPRRSTSCRAAYRQSRIVPPSDSVWISDDLLSGVFQQFFAGTKTKRRHGSFVPGPLECRRRTGKRKMAYVADPTAPMFGSRDLGGWLGSMQELSWRWRPPTTPAKRAEQREKILGLPRWLAGWVLRPHPSPNITLTVPHDSSNHVLPTDVALTREFLSDYRQALLGTEKREDISIYFNHYIRQSLTIGAVEENLIHETLAFVTETINTAFTDRNEALAQRLDFYHAIWDGLSACRVIPLRDLQAATINTFLSLLSELPLCTSSKDLVKALLNAVSTPQLEAMTFSISQIVKSWSLSHSKMSSAQLLENKMLQTQQSVETTTITSRIILEQLEASFLRLVEDKRSVKSLVHTKDYRNSSYKLKCLALDAVRKIAECENILYPIRLATIELLDCFSSLSAKKMNLILGNCLTQSQAMYNVDIAAKRRGPNYSITWLTLAAQLPTIDHGRFIQAWKSVERNNYYIPDHLGSELILLRLIKEGYLQDDIELLRNHFEAGTSRSSSKSYSSLLAALLTYNPRSQGIKYLIETLQDLGRHSGIADALCYVKDHHIAPSCSLLQATISNLARVNARLALRVYRAYIPTRYTVANYNHPRHPTLLFSMIEDSRVEPADIWRTVGKQITSSKTKYCSVTNPGHPELILEMADRFSKSSARPQRVALRNVTKCLQHLNKFETPIPQEMSRAVAYVGVTREVLRDNWVGKERLRWILSTVERGEGYEVAREIETLVQHWTERLAVRNGNKRILKQQQDELKRHTKQV